MQKQKLSSIPKRIIAWFLDLMITSLIANGLGVVAMIALLINFPTNFPVLILIAVIPALAWSIIVYGFFYVYIPIRYNGKTIGKALMGQRIVRIDGKKLNAKALSSRIAVMYFGMQILSIFSLIAELGSSVLSKENQSIHDLAAKTLVVDSPTTSATKKKLLIIYLVTVLVSIFLVVAGTVWFFQSLPSVWERNSTALIGTDGPVSQTNDIGDLFLPEETLKAIDLSFEGRWMEAKEAIDIAFKKESNSMAIYDNRCWIYYNNYDTSAEKVCREAITKYPNHPSIIHSTILILLEKGKCNEISELADRLARMKMLDYHTQFQLGSYYGGAGVALSECELEPELSQILIQAAIERTEDPSELEFLRSYLNQSLVPN